MGRGVLGIKPMFLAGLDVSQAFMTIGATRNSPDATIHVNYEGRTNFSMG